VSASEPPVFHTSSRANLVNGTADRTGIVPRCRVAPPYAESSHYGQAATLRQFTVEDVEALPYDGKRYAAPSAPDYRRGAAASQRGFPGTSEAC
jgi:hypothetical protein